VLDRDAMMDMVERLCASAEVKAGDRVRTWRGLRRGMPVRILGGSRVAWRPDTSGTEFAALPEGLWPERRRNQARRIP
jgi:hypothetical protein